MRRTATCLTVLLASLLFSILTGCAPMVQAEREVLPEARGPRLTKLNVPPVFTANRFESPVMLFSMEGENLDPLSRNPIELKLFNAKGAPVEARFTNPVYVQDVAFGDASVGLVLADSSVVDDTYMLCAEIVNLEDPMLCETTKIILSALDPCQEAFLKAQQENPEFGCRCAGGTVRYADTDSPDGSLGSFSSAAGGNKLGPYRNGSLSGRFITSILKLEPYFTVEVLNDPGRPEECSEQQWQALSIGLCAQGQKKNGTIVFRAGVQNQEIRYPSGNIAGKSFPYRPDTRGEADFMWDGHGYKVPGPSGVPHVQGNLKSHDSSDLGAPGLIRWLDSPGFFRAPTKNFWGLVPIRQDNYFHSFVHGTTGKEEDDCDCYFGVRSGVIFATGEPGIPGFTSIPQCN